VGLFVFLRELAMPALPPKFFAQDADTVARGLLGATLLFQGVGGVIVETESYDTADPASHSHKGRTSRNASMFGVVATAYVYRSYGIHWCLNLVCGTQPGGAVLIRALQPTHGLDAMRERRGLDTERLLCGGPGRLTQALGLTISHDGLPLDALPFQLLIGEVPTGILVGPRIGITKNKDAPRRFGIAGSRWLSRGFGNNALLLRASGSILQVNDSVPLP